jgi:mannose/cellobiose epimerase-like protein (N-acyl-D-glucosamine 2-epimerase family)
VTKNGRIDIGHQFEWAYLLSHAVEKGFSREYLSIGERLLDFGMQVGYDNANGGIYSTSDYDGNSDRRPKSWWQQNELLRALIHYAVMRDRPDLWEPFKQSLTFVKQHFIDNEYGGWYASYDSRKLREGNALNKGNLWQVGYHVCGMYVEVLRLAGILSNT